jgi:hypothetical protein
MANPLRRTEGERVSRAGSPWPILYEEQKENEYPEQGQHVQSPEILTQSSTVNTIESINRQSIT